jgi:hypothetical protein
MSRSTRSSIIPYLLLGPFFFMRRFRVISAG